MTYYAGQPVLSVMTVDDAYRQECGPDMGKPVVRGIVAEVWGDGGLSVWWENVGTQYFTKENEVKPLDN